MRTSALTIHRLIEKEKHEITDEQFFSSKQYGLYLTDLAESITDRFKRPLIIQNLWQENSKVLANTDNRIITINCNHSFLSDKSRRERHESILGLLFHETGHALFSDFHCLNLCGERIVSGIMYPKIEVDSEDIANYQEIISLLKKQGLKFRKAIANVVLDTNNSFEDFVMEMKLCSMYPGVEPYITKNNMILFHGYKTVEQQIASGLTAYEIMHNFILYYTFHETIYNPEGYNGIYLDLIQRCAPVIMDAIHCKESLKRIADAVKILVILWPLIKNDLLENSFNKQNGNNHAENGLGNGRNSQQSTTGLDNPFNDFTASIVRNLRIPKGSDKPVDQPEEFTEEKIRELIKNKWEGLADYKEEDINISSGLESVLNEIAEDRVNQKIEIEILEVLRKDANKEIAVSRKCEVSDSFIQAYHNCAKPFEQLAGQFVKRIAPLLQDRREEGKLVDFYAGSGLNMKRLYRDNGKYFYKNKLPREDTMAVSILVDESGSMKGQGITAAKNTCIMLFHFCSMLHIPIMILGHNYYDGKVQIHSYADFNSIDGKDRYRLMEMEGRGNNYDEIALRFALERLMNRTENIKMQILISDGLPSVYETSLEKAELNLHTIQKEYTNKGILFFAAAIGSDKERICRIYGNSFLDISDLSQLPVKLTNLITRYLCKE